MGRSAARQNPWLQVLVLAVVGVFAFIDRQILVLMIEPVKRDLQISDTGVSLLVGGAFVIFYALVALPVSRLADRWSRKGVILLGVAAWSLMTIMCGFASGFGQLFVARMGVGLGEAAFSPAAYALTAETIPARRWGLALGVIMLSASIGYGLALMGGAAIIAWAGEIRALGLPLVGALAGWQLVFVISGLLTLLTVIPLALLKPERRVAAPVASPQPWSAVWRRVWRERGAYAALFVAIPPTSLVAYGCLAWLPSYLIRAHAMTPVSAGMVLGLIALVFGGAGILTGAVAMDRLGRTRTDAPVIVAIAAIAAIGTGCLLLPLAGHSRPLALAIASLVLFALGASTPTPPVALQVITPAPDRAQVSAAYLFVSGVMGIGLGATAVALVTDRVFHSEAQVGASMAVVGMVGCGLSVVLLLAFRGPFRRLAARLRDQNSEG